MHRISVHLLAVGENLVPRLREAQAQLVMALPKGDLAAAPLYYSLRQPYAQQERWMTRQQKGFDRMDILYLPIRSPVMASII